MYRLVSPTNTVRVITLTSKMLITTLLFVFSYIKLSPFYYGIVNFCRHVTKIMLKESYLANITYPGRPGCGRET